LQYNCRYIITIFSHFFYDYFADAVTAVPANETPASLWGDDKPDPKDALVQNGFQMRRVVLTHQPRVNNKFKSSSSNAKEKASS
jgi:hypothetical protein